MASDSEWIKILTSAMVGLLAGLIADPLKSAFQAWLAVLRMQRSIRMDAFDIRTKIECLNRGLVPEYAFWATLDLPAYDHYWEKNRELFYRSYPLQTLSTRCRLIKMLGTSVSQGAMTAEKALPQVNAAIQQIFDEGKDFGFLHRTAVNLIYKLFG